jgi:RNA polymerase-binding transcription factor DksA
MPTLHAPTVVFSFGADASTSTNLREIARQRGESRTSEDDLKESIRKIIRTMRLTQWHTVCDCQPTGERCMTNYQPTERTKNDPNRTYVVWNRLHSEREETCEALLSQSRVSVNADVNISHGQLLEARLIELDAALDRIMAGKYGECIRCGRWIEDTRLAGDPALAFCIDCQQRVSVH